MRGEAEILNLLNEQLTSELTAINQYFLHSRMQDSWGFTELAAHTRAESFEEMRHAELLTDRILLLDGLPNYHRSDRFRSFGAPGARPASGPAISAAQRPGGCSSQARISRNAGRRSATSFATCCAGWTRSRTWLSGATSGTPSAHGRPSEPQTSLPDRGFTHRPGPDIGITSLP
jgi:hypothetical protein